VTKNGLNKIRENGDRKTIKYCTVKHERRLKGDNYR
jgi:hypothetical protein